MIVRIKSYENKDFEILKTMKVCQTLSKRSIFM